MIKIVAMIIYMGGWHGGQAAIPGFQSLASCQSAIPAVLQQIATAQGRNYGTPWAVCVEVNS